MSNEYGQDQPASTIPDELPPRPQPTVQRGGFRNCLTFKFLRSYSLRGVRDRRTKFRRIAMIVVLFILAGMAVLDFVFTIISNLGLGIVFTILDVFFLWAMAWSLAVIGDAVGVKKFMGMTFVSSLISDTQYLIRRTLKADLETNVRVGLSLMSSSELSLSPTL